MVIHRIAQNMNKADIKQLTREELGKALNENELNFNTQIAVENFRNEVKGNYIITTLDHIISQTGKEKPETILAYSTPQNTRFVKQRILKMMEMDEYRNNDIYFGQIKWSSKDDDKVLSFIAYQRAYSKEL